MYLLENIKGRPYVNRNYSLNKIKTAQLIIIIVLKSYITYSLYSTIETSSKYLIIYVI